MRRLIAFNSVTLDGYFTDAHGDMRWAYDVKPDKEFDAFVAGNASGGGQLLFGRLTYEMMASYWPTADALRDNPVVAAGMNSMPKVVFSRTLDKAAWNNTQLLKGDIASEVTKLKQQTGKGMAILGSGSIIAQLAPLGLIDEYQIVLTPVVLGGGRTLFEGITERLKLRLLDTRTFGNGKVCLRYEPSR
jgi:dihydrofolate reductase